MNKSEFIRAYADNFGGNVTIKEAEKWFNVFVDTLTDSLKKGEYIHISGFATFELKDKAARDGVKHAGARRKTADKRDEDVKRNVLHDKKLRSGLTHR